MTPEDKKEVEDLIDKKLKAILKRLDKMPELTREDLIKIGKHTDLKRKV